MKAVNVGPKGWRPKAIIEKAPPRTEFKLKHMEAAFKAGFLIDPADWCDDTADEAWKEWAGERGFLDGGN